VIERAVILAHGPQVLPEELPAHFHARRNPVHREAYGYHPTVEDLERDYIAGLLQESGWHRLKGAQILGLDRRMRYRKMRAYGLKPSTYGGMRS
jgi:transcriptional regulator of acetoin/glycerol metabolism